MAFQILNREGVAITLNELDREVAEFWGVEVSDNYYASPVGYLIDWKGTIGWTISEISKERILWSDVIGILCGVASTNKVSFDGIMASIETYKPYIELCLYWAKKGYKPVSC